MDSNSALVSIILDEKICQVVGEENYSKELVVGTWLWYQKINIGQIGDLSACTCGRFRVRRILLIWSLELFKKGLCSYGMI